MGICPLGRHQTAGTRVLHLALAALRQPCGAVVNLSFLNAVNLASPSFLRPPRRDRRAGALNFTPLPLVAHFCLRLIFFIINRFLFETTPVYVLRLPCAMFSLDWRGLILPIAYMLVLGGTFITFSSVYRKRKAGECFWTPNLPYRSAD